MLEDKKYSLSKQNIEDAYEDLLFREAMAEFAEEESEEIEKELLEMPPLSDEEIERKKKEFEAILNRKITVPDEPETKKKKGITLAFAIKKVISAAAMITFVMLVSLSTVVVASADARETVAEFIYSFAYNETGEVMEIRPNAPLNDTEKEKDKILGEWVATYIPEGYSFVGVEEFSSMKITEYKKGDSSIYLNESGLTTVAHVDTKDADSVERIIIGESEALLVVKNGTTSIDWCTDDTFLSVIGNAEKNDMIAFARGVRKTETYNDTEYVDEEVYSYEDSYAPTYMAEGFVLGNIYGESTDDLTVEYSNGNKMIVIDQFTHGIMRIDISDAEVQENIKIGSNTAVLVIKDDVVSVTWSIGDKTIHVWGNADKEEIIKVAASIKIVE
ncbi:MAG: DUF4367 domain-containing protein [Oscillospiraceae bacterium]|nr:DUF4367 domain-containing protein [Oscillospiraceae bacterium]